MVQQHIKTMIRSCFLLHENNPDLRLYEILWEKQVRAQFFSHLHAVSTLRNYDNMHLKYYVQDDAVIFFDRSLIRPLKHTLDKSTQTISFTVRFKNQRSKYSLLCNTLNHRRVLKSTLWSLCFKYYKNFQPSCLEITFVCQFVTAKH